MISNRSNKRPALISPLSARKDDTDDLARSSSKYDHLFRRSQPEPTSAGWIVAMLIILCVALNAGSAIVENRLYYQRPAPSADSPFGAEAVAHTRRMLGDLTRTPRVAGTPANEVEAVQYILATLREIRAHAAPDVSVEIDVQRPCGSFHMEFLNSFSNSYCNITNVVARLSLKKQGLAARRAEDSPPSVLVNAHFDSFVSSPGASDDGLGVAVMLQVLREMSRAEHPGSRPGRLQNPVVFLFNGAEESNLQGSHGFISQHKWAHSVRSLINLEAIGSGGRELMFQCNSPWIAGVYASSAPYPHSSGIAHEFFQLLLWRAAATDWRPVIEFGPPGIAGADFAYVENGYVYHTSFDTADIIDDGTIMHTGSNILQFAFALSAAPELGHPFEEWAALNNMQLTDDKAHVVNPFDSDFLFFDVLGRFQVVYAGRSILLVHGLGVLLGLAVCWLRLPDSEALKAAARHAFYGQAASMLTALVTGIVYAFAAPMRWYGGGYVYASFILIPPILLTEYLLHERAISGDRLGSNAGAVLEVAGVLYWTVLLGATTAVGHRGSYLMLLWAVGCSASVMLRGVLQVLVPAEAAPTPGYKPTLAPQPGQLRDVLVEVGAALPLVFPAVCWLYQLTDGLELIVPLMGKTGQAVSGEILLALLYGHLVGSYVRTPIMNPFLFPDVNNYIKQHRAGIQRCVVYPLGAAVVCLLCCSAALASPYSESRPKRLWLHHVERDMTGRGEGSDAGLWVVGFDALGLAPIEGADVSPRLDGRYRTSSFRGRWWAAEPGAELHPDARPGVDEHRQGFNCGLLNGECYLYWPYYFPVAEVLRDAYYIPTKGPIFGELAEDESKKLFSLTASSGEVVDGKRRIELLLTGPTHLTLALRDGERGRRVLRWGVLQTTEEETKAAFVAREIALGPAPEARLLDGVHYMQIGFGMCKHTCLFRMTLEVEGSEPMDVSAYGHYVLMRSTDELRRVAAELPLWARGAEWTNFVSKVVATRA